MSELIRARESTLAELLRSGCFRVPRHQRYYDWEGEHVNTLLQDLAEAVNEDSPCHFLGSIMLIKTNGINKWEINDGQQRIITFSLICAYLCRTFHAQCHSSGESNTLRVLFDIPEGHNETLQSADSLSPRVVPPENNKTNFNNLVRGHDIGTNGKLVVAWNNIVSFFGETEHQDIVWQKRALNFILNKFIVIRLEVERTLDPNAIFETLNYRGKHLEQVDLIKNYFLSFFNSDVEFSRCDTMHDNFKKIYASFSSKIVSEYFRCYMQAQYGFINKERFFRETKKRFGGASGRKSKEIFDLMNGLAENGRIQIFKTFLRKSANQEFLQKLTTDARKTNNKRKIEDYLLDLHDYTITRPILFALFYCYSDAPRSKKRKTARFVYNCAKILASFVQRVTHLGNFRPSTYEAILANLAMDVFNGNCTTTENFFDILKKCDTLGITNDDYYIEQMETRFYANKSLVKKHGYILKGIVEFQERGVRIDDKKVSIEHILPKSKIHQSKVGWVTEFSTNDVERFLNCLGNLTLLSVNENSPTENDNESFSAKKRIYKKSSYEMTRHLCCYPKWTPDSIRNRQRDLVKIAAKKIWNFDFN